MAEQLTAAIAFHVAAMDRVFTGRCDAVDQLFAIVFHAFGVGEGGPSGKAKTSTYFHFWTNAAKRARR